ncbi:MAG: hypothetical protein OEQ25_00370 [Gammaproteobacteria bacterium]|nr:hypothetical protein [Gammaproteobacteria bacterium]MDH3505566.1 hypothetical protein [Gammaproteobacteria bacterium]
MGLVIVSRVVTVRHTIVALVRRGFLGTACAGALLAGILQGCTRSDAHPDLSGMWSTTTTAVENPGWTVAELFACNCTPDTYEYIDEMLLPQNDHLSAAEIRRAVLDHNERAIAALMTEGGREYAAAYDLADDPAIQCEYFGVFRSMLHNDPILIEQSDDRVVIRGEDMSSDRVIFMDGRGHPDDEPLSSLGHSIGWYEGSALVVETVNVAANLAEDNLAIHNADNARSIERYTLSDDGLRLRTQLTLIDPVNFREPLVLENIRLRTPDVALEDAPCESISGQR